MRRNVSRSLAVSVIRSGIPQSYPGDGEGRQEICIHGGMGLPGLGGRRSNKTIGHRSHQTMLRMPPGEEGPGLRVFNLHPVSARARCGRASQQPKGSGSTHRLGARADGELRKDTLDMGFYRLR